MRITALLQKIHELASQGEYAGVIDVDLMLDYTRVLYSDLLEWRSKIADGELTGLSQPQPQAESALQPKPNDVEESAAAQPVAAAVALPDPIVEEPEPEPEVFREPELTLEEYLARQRKEDEEAEEALMATHVPRPGVQQPLFDAAPESIAAAPVTVAKAEASAPVRDIRTMIGINDKYQIMSELFGNDKAAYEQALDFINRAESEQAAFNWLRERLWVTEDHSDAAMIFFDVVRRFKNP